MPKTLDREFFADLLGFMYEQDAQGIRRPKVVPPPLLSNGTEVTNFDPKHGVVIRERNAGTWRRTMQELEQIAACPEVRGIILQTTCVQFLELPGQVGGKPLFIHYSFLRPTV
jgi:hypothetical protein